MNTDSNKKIENTEAKNTHPLEIRPYKLLPGVATYLDMKERT